MVATLKFSEFFAAGAIADGSTIVGLANDGLGVTNASFTASGLGTTWVNVTDTSETMVGGYNYFPNNASLVTLTLPLLSAVGDQISISGVGAGGFLIAQNASQFIQIGTISSTVGVLGSVASSSFTDSLTIVCAVANTRWNVLGSPQSSGLDII